MVAVQAAVLYSTIRYRYLNEKSQITTPDERDQAAINRPKLKEDVRRKIVLL
jgi:hypothetical protein